MKSYILLTVIGAPLVIMSFCRADKPEGERVENAPKATLDQRVFGNGDVLISELDKVVDRELIQSVPSQTNLWKAVSYKSDEFAGQMVQMNE